MKVAFESAQLAIRLVIKVNPYTPIFQFPIDLEPVAPSQANILGN